MAYADLVNRLSSTTFGGALARATAAHVDPWIYRVSGGRLTMAGPPTIPQLTLTTMGRKSGERRDAQLGYLADGDDYVVVASNFGQQHHPGWMYNLEADPRAVVRCGRDVVAVTAERLGPEDKAEVWPRLCEVVPQFRVYETRTDRDIRVFRLRPG